MREDIYSYQDFDTVISLPISWYIDYIAKILLMRGPGRLERRVTG